MKPTKKTILLAFIHGFKGNDQTFQKFPEHLRVLVSNALPKVNVLSVVYPQYETKGILHDCVAGFKEWLQDRVIDLEVAAGTPSPTVDPSVRVILVGHSMGGIVAAETLLSIARDKPVPADVEAAAASNKTNPSTSASGASSEKSNKSKLGPVFDDDEADADSPTFLFPYIQGILAFDTPYLGIHPGVVAHGAESHWNTASAAYNAYTQATSLFGGGNASRSPSPAPASNSSGGWGKYAMFAGGAAAVAAAGGAAWMGRTQLSEGWKWVGGHLEFVGCLARGAELTQRVDAVAKLSAEHCLGFADFYTMLASQEGKTGVAAQVLGDERTFCVIPKEAKSKATDAERDHDSSGSAGQPRKKRRKTNESAESVEHKVKSKGTWIPCVNKKASDEITAHRTMFTPAVYPGYYGMSEKAKNTVVDWVDKVWYESSVDDGEQDAESGAGDEDGDGDKDVDVDADEDEDVDGGAEEAEEVKDEAQAS